jgi:hypothetical protein
MATQFPALGHVGHASLDALDVLLPRPGTVIAAGKHLYDFRRLGNFIDRTIRATRKRERCSKNYCRGEKIHPSIFEPPPERE